MSVATVELPSDPDALRAFAAALQAELYAKTLHIEKLKAQLAALRRARFGQSSEKLDRQIDLLELIIGDLEEAEAAGEARRAATAAAPGAMPVPASSQRVGNRRPLPDHLLREIVTHAGACACPACGSQRLRKIGDDEREVLEYVPSHFKVIVHVRPKLSCRDCETITQPAMASLPIERGRPGQGLLAHVLVAKYCDHLPLNRQSGIYAREGVDLDRSTLADWVGRAAWLVAPVAERIGDYVRASPAVHADDTPIPVQDPGRGRTRSGRLWVVVRDEGPWGSPNPPAAFYRYAPDRKGEYAQVLLAPVRGFLHADAYAGFDKLYEPDPVTGRPRLEPAACWAHARRELFDEHARTKSPIVRRALDKIGAIFAIERQINGHSAEARLAARQAQSMPLLADLKEDLETSLGRISRKGDLAKAIRYSLNRWQALCRFTEDGRLEMTNNAAERAIRPLTLGRRNWTFLGSDAGGERAAVFYTLIQTCKLNRINPEAYLADLIGRVAGHPASRIDELLPWNWRGRSDPIVAA
ncbi:IS66 family transposase [Phreatobacter sp. AB_2022a]|uniref:IS66 family transposase n=1 Tax=Phreatobacter sp. AB_2022a TaxID=3003134 RepID=UPI0022874DE9|nr:IS66 family transposase [Phreatobacter sp. AB_2022a]MCZ0737710.1 IS66 family transposase [Phreatobacter sp. AB_2022a]